jgi:hypothetical protein
MLDPSTALSVACSVVQFVDFGTKLTSKGKEYYRSADGVLADHAEQAAISSKLAKLSEQVSISISASAANQKPSAAELALQEVRRRAATVTSTMLTSILGCGRLYSTRQRLHRCHRQAESIWEPPKMEKFSSSLQNRVEEGGARGPSSEARSTSAAGCDSSAGCHEVSALSRGGPSPSTLAHNDRPSEGQSKASKMAENATTTMEGQILAAIRQSTSSVQSDIQKLRRDVQKYNPKTSRGNQSKNVDVINNVILATWTAKNESIVQSILQKVDESISVQMLRSYKKNIMDSLWFHKIDDRYNMIDPKHEQTLNWIFEPPMNNECHWSSVPRWLRGPQSLYWVSGKAGSGKSTLMKWLFHQDRTRACLQTWAGKKKLFVSRYYFWLASKDQAQKSLSGLLRSILYDLLQQCPDFILDVFPSKWRSYDLRLAHSPPWTDADLTDALYKLIASIAPKACVCFFIDGLDEFDGKDHQRLNVISLLEQLSKLSTVKICVSSRTWELFKQAFADYPKLRLEDLTVKDIEIYITTTAQQSTLFNNLRIEDESSCSELISEIISKAQGVWLWVILVVRSLLRGLQYKDSVEDLRDRLREIPPELEEYFLQMFFGIEDFYRPKALRLFKIALNTPHTLSLMSLSFLDDWERDANFVDQILDRPVSDEEIVKRLDRTTTRLNARCLGLLETVSKREDTVGGVVVEFLHRTARDFIADSNTQKKISMHVVDDFDVDRFMCKSLLAQLKMLNRKDEALARVFATLVDDFMPHAVRLEAVLSERLMLMLDELDELIATGCPQHIDVRRSSYHPLVTNWILHMAQSHQLLPLSIQFGLRRYSRKALRARPALIKLESTWRPLLHLALLRQDVSEYSVGTTDPRYLVWDGTYVPDPELIRLMLEHGADPNETMPSLNIPTCTVWENFLQLLGQFQFDKTSTLFETEDQRSAFIESVELCIRYGAVRVLNVERTAPNQPSYGTQFRRNRHKTLARDSFRIVFGPEEADRLDALSLRLNLTGVNLATKLLRTVRAAFW